ncbi:NUDIX domain-containing protein [Gorillibacterium sp. sgz5001074]|uniref:NUDIX domain-containing protein n=1 Tax=Gorillibacterium sp. sgz5001074 TaxID=3446695 RepID=UPI003F67C157
MYTLRLMAVAMLFNGGDMLMMKRSPNRTLSPGMWAGVGGHLEPSELGDPRAACLREVEEETGLRPEEIRDLELKYILLRLNGTDLRQQFVYTGRTDRRDVATTEEGELHWIPKEEILNRDLPFVFRSLLAHWLSEEPSDAVWMGTATLEDAGSGHPEEPRPVIRWVPVRDPGRM